MIYFLILAAVTLTNAIVAYTTVRAAGIHTNKLLHAEIIAIMKTGKVPYVQ